MIEYLIFYQKIKFKLKSSFIFKDMKILIFRYFFRTFLNFSRFILNLF